ncbi:MAG: hypothetical protein HDR27_04725 [Lachnospiraceae bacterium]|nr:hypothetical protein [Lachnospiraceae bacterium]
MKRLKEKHFQLLNLSACRGRQMGVKMTMWVLALLLLCNMALLSGCSGRTEDPGEPPAEVVNPGRSSENTASDSNLSEEGDLDTNSSEGSGTGNADDSGEILENAISVRIGRDGTKEWNVNMYNNNAAMTMLDYLSGDALLFPTYTYEEEEGFVAQNVRGNYTRDDEQEIADVKAGELYLFSGGQLRLYFKDMEGANITATPVGYFADIEGLTEAVQEAYESNLDDTWGVDVYFWITKTLE